MTDHIRRDGYGVAQCDHHGNIPTRPADVRWIHTVHGLDNIPTPRYLMTADQARDEAVDLVRGTIAKAARGQRSHDAYAVVHITPDGWAPVMWAMPTPGHEAITLTLRQKPPAS